jgi:hypothetical protein
MIGPFIISDSPQFLIALIGERSPFKKLPSHPVASQPENTHLETKRSNEGKTESERAKTQASPLFSGLRRGEGGYFTIDVG